MNYLAADLGGTKTILAIYKWERRPVKIFYKYYLSNKWINFYLILNDFIQSIPGNISMPIYGCIGVAGPIVNNTSSLTNLNWELKADEISKIMKLKKCNLINDFSSLVYGIKYLDNNQYTPLQNKKTKIKNNNEVLAVIGAGTGLGMARGIQTKNGIKVLPSEGGHKDFAPRSQEEWELSKWLKKDLQLTRISIERIVSGPGLGHIARWVLSSDEAKGHPLHKTIQTSKKNKVEIDLPSIASKLAIEGDPIMTKAVSLWLKAYGSAAGDFALHELCYAGLWIAGGTSAKNIFGTNSKIFLRALVNKGRFKELLEKIPIHLITDQQAGLFGSACKAHINAELDGRLS